MDKTEKKIKMYGELPFLADLIHKSRKHARHRLKMRHCVDTKKNLNLKSKKQLPTYYGIVNNNNSIVILAVVVIFNTLYMYDEGYLITYFHY